MNKLYQSICLAALVMASFSAWATKLIVSQGTENCVFELASGDAVSINPATGDVSAVVSNLEDCAGAPEPPEITSFTRAPSSVESGQTVSVNWSTENVDTCSATGTLPTWTGSKGLQGPQNVTVNAPLGTYSVGLQCTGAGQTVTAGPLTVTVTDDGGGGGGECTLPTGLSRAADAIWGQSASNASGHFWDGVFIGPFPSTTNSRTYFQRPGNYHAIQFNTGNMPSDATGQINSWEPQGPWSLQAAAGWRIVSFSTCPGDFNPDGKEPGCIRRIGGTDNIRWGGANTGDVFRCALQPNTTYYLNIVYTDSQVGDPNPNWNCSGPRENCGALMQSAIDFHPTWP